MLSEECDKVSLKINKDLANGGLTMKKVISFLVFLAMFIILSACSNNLTEKSDIISLYQKKAQIFLLAAENGDFSAIEGIKGVQKVLVWDTHIDIQCGGAGFGPSTHYYGIFYSADDNLCAIDVAGPRDEMVEQGDGYFYQEENGDNRYYVEPLGNHFYYYEAHF